MLFLIALLNICYCSDKKDDVQELKKSHVQQACSLEKPLKLYKKSNSNPLTNAGNPDKTELLDDDSEEEFTSDEYKELSKQVFKKMIDNFKSNCMQEMSEKDKKVSFVLALIIEDLAKKFENAVHTTQEPNQHEKNDNE
ncbi:hypothetical protein BDAP_000657 [Binucleata daphniae]